MSSRTARNVVVRYPSADFAPALLIGLFSTGLMAATQLVPVGENLLLIRLGDTGPEAALAAAAAADATLVRVPAPGFAVLHGDAARARAAFGWATLWTGNASCSTTP